MSRRECQRLSHILKTGSSRNTPSSVISTSSQSGCRVQIYTKNSMVHNLCTMLFFKHIISLDNVQ